MGKEKLMRCIGCNFLIDSRQFICLRFDLKCPKCNQVNISDFVVVSKTKTPR